MGVLGRWAYLVVALIFLSGRSGADVLSVEPYLELESDSPAVLDAPITIFATLKNKKPGTFYFSFTDDASPMHFKEVETNGLTGNFTLSYPSKMYEDRKYTMTVRVYEMFTIFRNEIAKGSIDYQITRTLNGKMVARQINGTVVMVKQEATIQTKVNTNFEAMIHDPENFLKNSSLFYYWFINKTNYGSTNSTTFDYSFGNAAKSEVMVLVLAAFPGSNPEDVQEMVAKSQSSTEAMNIEVPHNVKIGFFNLNVAAKNPMMEVKVGGDKWLKHGKLLNLTVTCNGTGPWSYCWKIVDSSYNSTGNETCGYNFETLVSTCKFEIIWYFRSAGARAVLLIVDNVLDHSVKQVGINVYDVPHRVPVSLIVIPLCSALIAVAACISGIFVMATFKRNMTGLETADFDFSCPEEQLEFKTFWERLRNSMLNALSNANKDDVSHVSSVSSRSIQGPPVGIHYGSIT